MEHYAGIDVSLERSSVCVVDALGKIVKEAKISSEPASPTQPSGQNRAESPGCSIQHR
jgi:predicted NBD/HSP70 family sugar kinase